MLHDRRRDAGFTLIEVAVVVVIVGVLSSISIPTYLNQKTKAVKAAMRADLRSVVLAEASYSDEAGGWTADLAVLRTHGYKRSDGVSTAQVVLQPIGYVACVSDSGASTWLHYSSVTGSVTEQDHACA